MLNLLATVTTSRSVATPKRLSSSQLASTLPRQGSGHRRLVHACYARFVCVCSFPHLPDLSGAAQSMPPLLQPVAQSVRGVGCGKVKSVTSDDDGHVAQVEQEFWAQVEVPQAAARQPLETSYASDLSTLRVASCFPFPPTPHGCQDDGAAWVRWKRRSAEVGQAGLRSPDYYASTGFVHRAVLLPVLYSSRSVARAAGIYTTSRFSLVDCLATSVPKLRVSTSHGSIWAWR